MKKLTIAILLILTSTSTIASNLKSDEMCQQYVTGLANNIPLAENVAMHALRVSLNRIADTHPEYFDIANQIAFGTALSEEGHRRTGSYINYECTQEGSVLNDLTYEVLLTESIRIIKERSNEGLPLK